MAGHDIGELCKKMFGREEHEYWVTVPAAEEDNLLLVLLDVLYHGDASADVNFESCCRRNQFHIGSPPTKVNVSATFLLKSSTCERRRHATP